MVFGEVDFGFGVAECRFSQSKHHFLILLSGGGVRGAQISVVKEAWGLADSEIRLFWTRVTPPKVDGGRGDLRCVGTRRLTMSSTTMTSSSAAYKNLLEAHTAFVLDRYAFMENVQKAVLAEDTSGGAEILKFLKTGTFIELIGGLMFDPDLKNREQALFTLGNLLALEHNDVIVKRVAAVVLEKVNALFNALYSPATPAIFKTAAYVIHNLAMAGRRLGWAFQDASGGADCSDVSEFCGRVFDLFNGLYGGALISTVDDKNVRTDLLYAVNYVAERYPTRARIQRILTEIADASVRDTKPLLDILNLHIADAEGDAVPVECHDDLMNLIYDLMVDDQTRHLHAAALWCLSNFVMETGVAEKIAGYDALLNEVVGKALTAGRASVRANAVWTLANMVTQIRDPVIQAWMCEDHGLWAAFIEAGADAHDMGRFKADTVAEESIDRLSYWQALYRPLEPEESESDSETESVESDDSDDSDWVPEEEEESDDDDDDAETIEEEATGQEVPVPTALDLLMAGRVPSANVRYLISLVQSAGLGTWVEIPADTVLTVDDLTTIQMMGFSVLRGHIGVNPLLISCL
jgi:hypothetical protein